MIRQSKWMRVAEKVTNYIDKYVKLVGAEKKEEVLYLFDSMNRLFPQWVISTCPKMHPDILYTSRNGLAVFGYSPDYFIELSRLENYFAHVHENDQEDLYGCFNFAHETLSSLPPAEHQFYRLVFHYRFKKANGQYMYLHDEKATLTLKESGNLYYVLFRDLTAERTFNGVKVELFRQNNGMEKISEYKPSSSKVNLSKRESELLGLIKQGLSTKEIAWYLKISQYTVRNTKSRMFEKYNVNNSIELLNMAG